MKKNPPAVRILPMTNDLQAEFPGCASLEDVQQKYFLIDLPSRENGSYYYHKKGLKAVAGTVILFQCKASIIASATLTGRQQFEKPDEYGYNGCLYFDMKSIRTFNPITADIIRDIWPEEFKEFNQTKWNLNPTGYSELEKRLEHVMKPEMPPPTHEAVDLVTPNAGRVLVTEYRILRDTELARRVKLIHNFRCQICDHAIEIPNGGFYAESHHIQPLGQPHNGPDIIGNILCVCPNHHAELDYGVSSLSFSSLQHSASHKIGQKYIDYHNQIILKSVNNGAKNGQ